MKSINTTICNQNSRILIKKVNIVDYFDLPDFYNHDPYKVVVQVRTVDTNEIFNVYEAQVRKFNYRGGETFFVPRCL